MTPGWQVVCYAVALGCFALAALSILAKRPYAVLLISLGLGAFALVLLWNATALD